MGPACVLTTGNPVTVRTVSAVYYTALSGKCVSGLADYPKQ